MSLKFFVFFFCPASKFNSCPTIKFFSDLYTRIEIYSISQNIYILYSNVLIKYLKMLVFILHFRVFVALNVFANIKTLICKPTRILLERLLTSMVPIFSIKLYPYFKILKWKWKKKPQYLTVTLLLRTATFRNRRLQNTCVHKSQQTI